MNTLQKDQLPLHGLVVLDMCQFLSGPYASLRLQDMGARVIKIERPDGGDLCRRLYLSDTEIDGDSTLFHAINRGKESFSVDLKSDDDIALLRSLIARADVLMQNFRPGVISRLGLDFEAVRKINPRIIYASISGYGEAGPWVKLPGQDLLAQARSGLMWLNGDEGQGPVPFGLAVADMLAGANCAQGILAALVRRGITGEGGMVETSLMEGMVDFQFEVLTTYLNDGQRSPRRASFRNAHAYLSAPYGVYQTADGWLALAMTPIRVVGELLELDALSPYYDDSALWFTQRDAIKQIIAVRLAERSTAHWLGIMEQADVWCAPVMEWHELLESDGFAALDMLQTLTRTDGKPLRTTRCPIRFDGGRSPTTPCAPRIGEHREDILREFGLSGAMV